MKNTLIIVIILFITTSAFAGRGTIELGQLSNDDKSKPRYFELYESPNQKKPTAKCKIKDGFSIDSPIYKHRNNTTKSDILNCAISSLFTIFKTAESWETFYTEHKNKLFKISLNTRETEYLWVKLPENGFTIYDHDKEMLEHANTFSKIWNGEIYKKPNGEKVALVPTDKLRGVDPVWMNYRFNKLDAKVINGEIWIKFNNVQYFKGECSSPIELLKNKTFWIRTKNIKGDWNIGIYHEVFSACS